MQHAATAATINGAPADLVGNWDFCPTCGGLTNRGVCDRCRRGQSSSDPFDLGANVGTREQHEDDVAADLAVQPPRRVVARPAHIRPNPLDSETATLTIPHRASDRDRRIMDAAAAIATRHLEAGHSLELALEHVALGRDQVDAEIKKATGVTYDRKTVAAGLADLSECGVLPRVGQLNTNGMASPFTGEPVSVWGDPNAADHEPVLKTGAYTYRLPVTFRRISGTALIAVIRRARSLRPVLMQLLGGEGRAQACLRWAIEHAEKGQRNQIGYWLARRCIDAGLPEDETMEVMKDFWEELHRTGRGSDFSWRQVQGSVRSAYSIMLRSLGDDRRTGRAGGDRGA